MLQRENPFVSRLIQMNAPLLQPLYAIAAVERETGLSKDTLRMWERRYGFPVPERDAKGERSYTAEQIVRLRHLRRLVQTGHRPGRIVPLDDQALALLLGAAANSAADINESAAPVEPSGALPRKPVVSRNTGAGTKRRPAPRGVAASHHPEGMAAAASAHVAACLRCISEHDHAGLREELTSAVQGMGLEASVLHLVAPLTQQVGQAWAEGRFAVYEEHLYTECVTGVLRAAIAGLDTTTTQGKPDSEVRPRVLLTTAPREQHGLGLLMLEALLALRGCVCLPLGTEMPIADIARAAEVFGSDIVALSFSGVLAAHHVQADLADLRRQLAPNIEIWAGGQGARLRRGTTAGVRALQRLEDVGKELDQRGNRQQRP